MANIRPVTKEMRRDWQRWLKGRPAVIQEMGARIKPWKLYRLKSTNQRVVPYSFNENGTMTVVVSGQFNLTEMEWRVFGIDPDDLEECDLPDPDEPLGVVLNEQEQFEMVNARRRKNDLPPMTMAEFTGRR